MDRKTKYAFTLPALILIGIIVLFPIIYNLFMSMNSWFVASGKGPEWIGFKNYVNLLDNPRFWNSLKVTFLFSLGALTVEVVLGTMLALFLNREFRGKSIVKLIFLFPIAATPVAVSLIWGMMFNYDLGIINIIMQNLGM